MNGTFSALMSTNEVYRDTDRTRCLTLDLEDLDTGKADSDHNHDSEYAGVGHTHETFNLLWQHPDGEGYLCVVPVYADENGTIDNICLKNFNIYNDKIVGKPKNYMGNNRRDAVLRCVYEF